MKRIISVFLIMLLLSTIHVSAAGSVSFSSDSIECKSNRLIEVNFNAECGKKLRAATFEFSFDKSILEFRGIGTPSGTIVEYNEKQNSVKLSYLCKNGADISSSAAIFTLKFKSINEGYTDISYTVFDCVDSDVQQMPVGSCTSGRWKCPVRRPRKTQRAHHHPQSHLNHQNPFHHQKPAAQRTHGTTVPPLLTALSSAIMIR